MPPPPPCPAKVLPGAGVLQGRATVQSGSVSPSAEPVLGPQWWTSKVRPPVRISVVHCSCLVVTGLCIMGLTCSKTQQGCCSCCGWLPIKKVISVQLQSNFLRLPLPKPSVYFNFVQNSPCSLRRSKLMQRASPLPAQDLELVAGWAGGFLLSWSVHCEVTGLASNA